MKPRTFYDKIWDDHLVHEAPDGTALLYIDRHIVHEVTSPQAFEGLRLSGRKVRAPEKTLVVVDHNVPTSDRNLPNPDPESAAQIAYLAENAKLFGLEYLDEFDIRQGICHVIGPEQGFTLPGVTLVCGDSHTATHGAFGALAYGIGTSEVEHVLATQTLVQKKSMNMRALVDGKLPANVTAKDIKLSDAKSVDRTKRPFRLPNGKPNLAGEWAQEQHVLASPPGGRVGLVPISQAAAIRAGKVPMPSGPRGWFPPPVTLTAAGRTAQEALRKRSTSEDPRLTCQITSILFDWVFDGAINRITQSATAIKMEYGAGLTRTVHMNLTTHPAKIAPSRGGHSIGRWDGDTLVVDTVGFLPGSIAGTLPHSDKLHIVERFTLNQATLELTRGIVVEDPVYFMDKYVDSDSVLPADAPFRVEACRELAPEYQQTGRK